MPERARSTIFSRVQTLPFFYAETFPSVSQCRLVTFLLLQHGTFVTAGKWLWPIKRQGGHIMQEKAF